MKSDLAELVQNYKEAKDRDERDVYFGLILTRVSPWCNRTIAAFARRHPEIDHQAIEQEVSIAIWKAIEKYDHSRGCNPITLIMHYVRGYLSHLVRVKGNARRKYQQLDTELMDIPIEDINLDNINFKGEQQ